MPALTGANAIGLFSEYMRVTGVPKLSEAAGPDPRLAGKKLAVIEDDVETDFDAGFARVRDGQSDVVVLDVALEGGNGLQVLRAVRAADPAVAFVVFSNNSGPAYRKRYLGEGAVRFLDKSTEFDQLAQAVATASGRAVH